MSDEYYTIEARLLNVIQVIRDEYFTNCTKTATVYKVSVKTLQRRWNEVAFRITRINTYKTFTDTQKQVVRDYIERLNSMSMSVKSQMIIKAANYLIREEQRVISHMWFSRFIKRNSQYYKRRQKSLTVNKKNSHDEKSMQTYFEA